MEFSEKELQDNYKNLKMMEVPDMWDEIERNLAPKKKKKEKIKKAVMIRRLGAMAAVVAAVVLLVPVWHIIRQNDMSKSDLSAGGSQEAYEGSSDGGNESASAETAMDQENGGNETEESLDTGSQVSDGVSQDKEDCEESLETFKTAEVQVEIQKVEQTIVGLVITAKLLDMDYLDAQAGDIIEIRYEGTDYEKEDFSGIQRLQLEKEENHFKLLEILP